MRAAIYNPYLDTLGGGERYAMAVATAFKNLGFRVDVQWESGKIKKKLESRFGVTLDGIDFVKDIKRGDGYDVCFWVSDGSIPILSSRLNLLHFQIPFNDVNGRSLLNKMKLFRFKKIICNSYFTKKIIDAEYGVESHVLYPPVDVENIKPLAKQNLILSVGRFSQLTQAKHQDILVDAFKDMCKKGLTNWELILAGGTEVGSDNFLKLLKKKAKNYPIKIIEKPSFVEIKKLFGVSKVFWFASGYGIDEEKDPKKVEHFGIAVVEAMAAGSIPVAYQAGGVKEIVNSGFNGLLWKKITDLKKNTLKLISQNQFSKELKQNALQDSKKYSYEEFSNNVKKIIS